MAVAQPRQQVSRHVPSRSAVPVTHPDPLPREATDQAAAIAGPGPIEALGGASCAADGFVGPLSVGAALREADRTTPDVLDLTSPEAIGRSFWEGLRFSGDPEVQRRLRDAVEGSAVGEVIRYRETVTPPAGAPVALEVTLIPLLAGDAVAAGVASALDVRERQVAEARTKALAVFTRHLVAASNVLEVASLVACWGPAVLQAASCRVALWDRDRGVLIAPDARSGGDGPFDAALAPRTRTPVGDAVLSGATVVVGRTAGVHEYPHLRPDWRASGAVAVAAAPLRIAPAELFGALDVVWTRPVELGPADLASLDTMADICAQALQRAKLHDAQDALVRALQQELLPGMPTVAGLQLTARYLPASDQLAFGGDWYDAIPISPTTTAVVVGDVVGHGVHAAARMARVRGVLDALIHLDPDPGTLFLRAHDLLATLQDPFIGTAALFLIDTAADLLTYASAGHPPALLYTSRGRLTQLSGGRAPALGIPTEAVTPGRVRFGSGSVLLAYTDGLVERRGEDPDRGVRRLGRGLRSALTSASRSPEATLEHIVTAATLGTRRRDDIAAVLVRRH
jgi:serine phosphatase RsbU (regulator of sigma subunit)